jgi:hypothetical protein
MYNLTVEEAHTFFVGDGDWLVHNTQCKLVFDSENNLVGFEGQLPGSTGVKVPRPITPQEMADLTIKYNNTEFSLRQEITPKLDMNTYEVKYETGDHWLFSGGRDGYGNMVDAPDEINGISLSEIYHTHPPRHPDFPNGNPHPSGSDIHAYRGRSVQVGPSGIIPAGERPARVYPFDGNTPPWTR